MFTLISALLSVVLGQDCFAQTTTVSPVPSRISAELGWRHLAGTGGGAWGEGTALRANVDWGSARAYTIQVSYGLSLHRLVDPLPLFSEPPTVTDWTGGLRMHSVHLGTRFRPEQILGDNPFLGLWLGSGVGLCVTEAQLTTLSRPDLVVDRVHVQPDFEMALGVDLKLSALNLSPLVRVTALPSFRKELGSDAVEGHMLTSVSVGAQLGWNPLTSQ